jgi:hypothetical protein
LELGQRAGLTGRGVPTALTGLWVTGLAVVVGIPDGIWSTTIHFTWLGAVAAGVLATSLAAAFIQTSEAARRRSCRTRLSVPQCRGKA